MHNWGISKKLSRREFLDTTTGVATGALGSMAIGPRFANARPTRPQIKAEIVVYGATPSGLAAATAATREGSSVVVIEPTSQTGGMVTGGIAVTDTSTPYLVGGLAGEFFDQAGTESRVSAITHESPHILFHGNKIPWNHYKPWDLEPKVARRIITG